MDKTPISVCMIGKNEERFLEGCLQKLVPYGFEIIFVDTGSTDDTRNIALKYTDKVFDFPWINDFSAARNFSAEHAINDWVIALDCDEYLKEIDLDKVLALLKNNPKKLGAIEIENIIRDGNAYGRSTQIVPRIYNRNYFSFEGKIHEQLRRKDGVKAEGFEVPLKVLHYGYSLSPDEIKAKNERNIALLMEEIKQEPNEPYYYFQLGQSYAVLNDYEKVFQYLQTGLALDPDPNQSYTQQMLIDYGTAMLHTGRYELAMNMELLYDSLCEYSDYLFLLGRIYYANQLPLKAIQAFVKATTAPKCIVFGTNSFFPLNSMALIYEQMGEKELAEECKKQVEALVSNINTNE